ncbi:hypothetical protein D9619_010133 [Psilocybe cf. subviscida]|uniref:Cell wall galactomannoprotein n=1 Tax=Psilocybe cf. subviscida TaxID=2480587 RepID=A0A8H5ES30_9AGAR|nr:hypothetical protein D9619_010133 [Psilocybe cf. subviscida]
MKLFAFSFNTVLATLVIGTISVAASTAADIQQDAIDACRLATSLNSELLMYQKTGKSDTIQDIVQACLNLNSGLKTLTSDAKKLVPQRMSADDTTGVCGTLEAYASTFQSIFDLFAALRPTFDEALPRTTVKLISDAVHSLDTDLSRMEAGLPEHFDGSAFMCFGKFIRTVDPSKWKCDLQYPYDLLDREAR